MDCGSSKHGLLCTTISILAVMASPVSAEMMDIGYYGQGHAKSFSEIQTTQLFSLSPSKDFILEEQGQFQVSSRYEVKSSGGFSYTAIGSLAPELFEVGHLTYEESDARFAAANTAYWIGKTVDSIRELGYLKDRQMGIKVHAVCKDMVNAYYTPFQNLICMGHSKSSLGVDALDGKAGTGWDASVAVHEFGHGIYSNLSSLPKMPRFRSFGNDLAGASNEGQADFIANVTTGSSKTGEWMVEIIKEDTRINRPNQMPYVENLMALRDSSNDLRMDRQFFGEIHNDGKIWAGVLYEMAQSTSNKVAMKLWLEALSTISDTDGFYEMGKAIIAADSRLHEGAYTAQLQQVLTDKGIFGQAQIRPQEVGMSATVLDDPNLVSAINRMMGVKTDTTKLNANNKLDKGECAPVVITAQNFGPETISGLEMFIIDSSLTAGVKNISPQNRMYIGKLNAGQSTIEVFKGFSPKAPWVYLCNETAQGQVELPVVLKGNSEGALGQKIALN